MTTFADLQHSMGQLTESIDREVELRTELIRVCGIALARIESDIETPKLKTAEGDALREVLLKARFYS
jgi:hypothetical protein